MTTDSQLGFAFAISLPLDEDQRLRRWATLTPGATWDEYGGHVTVARLTGNLSPEVVEDALREACTGLPAFEAAFTRPVRQSYWDKPGLEIVMLVAETDADIAGVIALRERILAATGSTGLKLAEGGPYVPHVTLTTGLLSAEAVRLETAADGLALRFVAREVVFWVGGETADGEWAADPPWRVVARVQLPEA